MTAVPSSPSTSTPDLIAIAAATELDFRQALDCDNVAALHRIIGGMSGRTQGVLAIAARLLAERDNAKAAIARVRALHHPEPWYSPGDPFVEIDGGVDPWGRPLPEYRCAGCSTIEDGTGTTVPWPCLTIAALDVPARDPAHQEDEQDSTEEANR